MGFTNHVVLGSGNKVTNLSSNQLTMTFAASVGTFSGSFTNPLAGKLQSFQGIVLQKLNAGYGFSLGTDQSSRVSLRP